MEKTKKPLTKGFSISRVVSGSFTMGFYFDVGTPGAMF